MLWLQWLKTSSIVVMAHLGHHGTLHILLQSTAAQREHARFEASDSRTECAAAEKPISISPRLRHQQNGSITDMV